MTDDKLLQQDEVDALLKAAQSGKDASAGEAEHDVRADTVPDGDLESILQETEHATDREPVFEESAGQLSGETSRPDDEIINQSLEKLTPEEEDALGEIGNISMGSAATTLSQLLNKRVLITSPTVTISSKKEFLRGFNTPFLVIRVKFREGFDGYNVLIIKLQDAIVMANLMMGGDGTDLPEEISEMEISAAAEAMNQMIGTASTSLADLLNTSINIMPPETSMVNEADKMEINLPFNDPLVVISFNMNIEELVDTSIMQVIDMKTARQQSGLLWKRFGQFEDEDSTESITAQESPPDEPTRDLPADTMELSENAFDFAGPEADTVVEPPRHNFGEAAPTAPQEPYQPPANGRSPVAQIDQDKLNLLLDIPLKVSVVLGRTRKQIKDVLQMTPGAIVELETLVGEPVEILVNGKLVASGEVVVVNENFGVKILSVISPRGRIHTLGANEFSQ